MSGSEVSTKSHTQFYFKCVGIWRVENLESLVVKEIAL